MATVKRLSSLRSTQAQVVARRGLSRRSSINPSTAWWTRFSSSTASNANEPKKMEPDDEAHQQRSSDTAERHMSGPLASAEAGEKTGKGKGSVRRTVSEQGGEKERWRRLEDSSERTKEDEAPEQR
uniref:Uncharacterized protein n=1 Tax=Mycena chlorophos TaxID=658473 RepID=A0ABQ0LAH7_MYCCL|nr:predicted protein [Mycena chlorophos]